MGLMNSSNLSQHLPCARSCLGNQNVNMNKIQSLLSRDSGSRRVTVICRALISLRMWNRIAGEDSNLVRKERGEVGESPRGRDPGEEPWRTDRSLRGKGGVWARVRRSPVQPTLPLGGCDESAAENLRPSGWKGPFKVISSNHPACWGLDFKGFQQRKQLLLNSTSL